MRSAGAGSDDMVPHPEQPRYAEIATLHAAIARFWRETGAACSTLGITPKHFEVLAHAGSSRSSTGPSLGRVADEACLAPSTTVGLVNELEAMGLLSREPDRWDRRVVRLEPTPAGWRALAQISHLQQPAREALSDAFAGLTRETGEPSETRGGVRSPVAHAAAAR